MAAILTLGFNIASVFAADNTYRYFYLYRNSDTFKSYHPYYPKRDNSLELEKKVEDNFRLTPYERDYYLKGDEEYDNYYEDDGVENQKKDSNNDTNNSESF